MPLLRLPATLPLFARRRPRRAVVLVALLAGLALAGCGQQLPKSASESNGLNSADANNNGSYVFAGGVTYQLQISRELNQYSTEDSQYVKGVPASEATLSPSQLWYGVFLWARNQTKQPQTTSDHFEIVDTQGHVYYPIQLNSQLNPFAWTSQTLLPNATEPGPGTIAADGPTQGGLLLFKVNQSVYDNRPLTLYLIGSNNKAAAKISLDL